MEWDERSKKYEIRSTKFISVEKKKKKKKHLKLCQEQQIQ